MLTKIMQALASAGKLMSRRAVLAPVIVLVTALCISVSAFSVETYIIRDGEDTLMHKSYVKDTRELLESVGKTLGELDDTVVSETENGDIEVIVMRAGTVNVIADGVKQTIGVRYDDKVSDALARAAVTVGEIDEVSAPQDSIVSYGSDITVSRIAITEETKIVEIPYEKQVKKNKNKYVGQVTVLQKGKNGTKEQVVEVKTRDGVVVSETVMKETVIEQPIHRITEQGTRISPNVIGASGTVTSRDGALRYSKVLEVTATAYSAEEHYTNQWTASGARARVGLIAVDPRVIPLGTRMYITSMDGKSWVYGYAVAADTGGAIKGNKIDLYFDTVRECNKFGRRKAKVYILE